MYKNFDDNRIIGMIKENKDSYEIIFNKYRPIIMSICKDFQEIAKKIGYELEDLMQVASIGLIDAIKNYDASQNVLFYTFMVHCIKNKLRNELRNQMTNKKASLNKSFSYDELLRGKNISYLNFLCDKSSPEPLDVLFHELDEITYINFLNSLPFEVAIVYEMRNSGCSYKEISLFLKIDRKTIIRDLNFAKNELMKINKKNLLLNNWT